MKTSQGILRWVVLVGVGLAWASPPALGTRAGRPPAIEDRMPLSRRLLSHICGCSPRTIGRGGRFFPQSVASGDPRPDSVILWTKVFDEAFEQSDLPVRLIVVKRGRFPRVVVNKVLLARAEYDHCIKVKVGNLSPNTRYFYRFLYRKDARTYTSRLGRTKTAPAADDNVPVKFAFVCCQDYNARYYNSYLKMLVDCPDLDFIVHLGDFVYETSGDQSCPEERRVDFSDVGGAIPLGTPDDPYLAAASLSNYRELYKTYLSDPVIQRIREKFPMIVGWDDHEYSDDCHRSVATYFNGRRNEDDPLRRRNAEQAFFEYVPVGRGLNSNGELEISDAVLYPNAQIYRDFQFGTNLHLVMTDYRSFRPDHLIPEDAFPGTVVMDRPTLEAVLTPPVYDWLKSNFDPYFPIETDPGLQGTIIAIVTQLYIMENPELSEPEAYAKALEVVTGNISATYINALFGAVGYPPPFDETLIGLMDRGLSYLYVGKQNLYGSAGSRYVVVKDTYDLLAGYLYYASLGASEDAFGPLQETWINDTIGNSSATWKVLASSVSATPMILDFTSPLIEPFLPPDLPDAYRTRLSLNVEQWDGLPNKRQELIDILAGVPNSLLISGDIHASFLTDHGDGVFEFTGTSISAKVLEDEVMDFVMSDPALGQVEGMEQLIAMLGTLLQVSSFDPAVSPAEIVYDNTGSNGFVVIEAATESLTATYYHIDSEEAFTNHYGEPWALSSLFHATTFRVQGGELTQVTP